MDVEEAVEEVRGKGGVKGTRAGSSCIEIWKTPSSIVPQSLASILAAFFNVS